MTILENTRRLQYKNPSREQFHPDLEEDFPCITSQVKIDEYQDRMVPWHWHEEVELFYIEEGILEYDFPKRSMLFPKGSGGFVNSNLIHKTQSHVPHTVQNLHIFNASLIGGAPGSRIGQKFVAPLITAPQIEIVPFFPDSPVQLELLTMLRESFQLKKEQPDYEIRLRNILSSIWCGIFNLAAPSLSHPAAADKVNDKLKAMIIYIHEHYAGKISVRQIASAAFISDRECFRSFQSYLSVTPAEYVRNYRIQKSCRLLAETSLPVTSVGLSCGFESTSYFIKTFREKWAAHLRNTESWQNSYIPSAFLSYFSVSRHIIIASGSEENLSHTYEETAMKKNIAAGLIDCIS